MKLEICCPSTGGHVFAVASWISRADAAPQVRIDDTIEGLGAGYLHKVEKFYRESTADILAYFHSDLFIHSHGWDEMVLQEFDTCENCGHREIVHRMQAPDDMAYPTTATRLFPCGRFFNRVAIVSFCGAKQHGRGDLYRAPYDFRQLARADFISNLTDAENHGRRVLEPEDVAVVDSFSVIVRRSFLDLIGGWLVSGLYESHASDYWICLMAHRHKMRIRYVPVSCTHNSGGVRGDGRFDYNAWQKWYGKTDAEMHQANHHAIYSEFKDVLPVRIP